MGQGTTLHAGDVLTNQDDLYIMAFPESID